MTPGLWGAGTAVCWGTADFVARFSGRAVGHHSSLLGMLSVGALLLTAWMFIEQPAVTWSWEAILLVVCAGVALMAATLWLYQGVARGPISIVEPIVCSYPILTVLLTVIDGHTPSTIQFLFMAITMAGVLLVARSTGSHIDAGHDRALLRGTILISILSAIAFGVGVYLSQRALPLVGDLPTLWSSRIVSLASLIILMLVMRERPALPARWWGALASQGLLDTAGYAALYQAAYGEGSGIAAVVASSYGALSTLLAWIILRERVNRAQWAGIALVFGGVAGLSAS
jgi:drug/metabolite transporter (DMT)-like permease